MADVISARPLEVVELVLGASRDGSGVLDVEFETPGGGNRCVPAFTAGGEWRVRYAAPETGEHHYHAHGPVRADGIVRVSGPSDPAATALSVRVASDYRRFETVDGSPFLWLADTWWDALTDRVTDDELVQLASRRAGQGFSVVQLVAGLCPEMAPFSPEGALAGGWAWHAGFSGPNERWFDQADTRVQLIMNEGLVPCIVGAWGYYLQHMTVDQMVRHWRELIARWGAYPVVWCLAGEVTALDPRESFEAASALQHGRPIFLTLMQVAGRGLRHAVGSIVGNRPKGFPDSEAIATLLGMRTEVADQVVRWHDVARAVRSLDPYGRLVTVHPQPLWPPYELIEDPSLIDFWMLQTGHSGYHTLASSVAQLDHALAQRPRKPTIVSEVCYEGILGSSGHEMQRFLFWSHTLSGAAGHTYGAQGLWGFNTSDYPGGIGGRWNELTWQEAAQLPGAEHVGVGRKLLLTLPWSRFEPHPEWVRPHATRRDRIQPYAAGTDNGIRVLYFPVAGLVKNSLGFHSVKLDALGTTPWRAKFVNPRTGIEEQPITIEPDADGSATLTGGPAGPLPSREDWVMVLTRV